MEASRTISLATRRFASSIMISKGHARISGDMVTEALESFGTCSPVIWRR
ncbi:hypothetical protein TIFTF001_018597 [Ficus carica]|uniref:Uncharacterized protein n=1 Tax=Ficus carica TaxID=3494 RepID=A0AA88ACS3_FICCA|nr:hypothetical protein TIFTF001_018597 [Ficus carica]